MSKVSTLKKVWLLSSRSPLSAGGDLPPAKVDVTPSGVCVCAGGAGDPAADEGGEQSEEEEEEADAEEGRPDGRPRSNSRCEDE